MNDEQVRNQKIKDVMNRVLTDASVFTLDSKWGSVAPVITRTTPHLAVVVNDFSDQKVEGVVTSGDVTRFSGSSPVTPGLEVSKVMNPNYVFVDPDKTIGEAVRLMNEKGIDNLIVTDSSQKLLGVLNRSKLAQAVRAMLSD